MIFLIFGSLLAPFGSLLAPFGSLLAPFECQTSSKILFLFDLVSPFADVRNHFCKKVNVGTLSARTRIVGTPICGNPSLRPRAELCRRHLDKLYCSGFGAAFKNRRAKTPADIIKDNPQAPTETEIRVFPRHLTGHPLFHFMLIYTRTIGLRNPSKKPAGAKIEPQIAKWRQKHEFLILWPAPRSSSDFYLLGSKWESLASLLVSCF